jgi:hypothetical protein
MSETVLVPQVNEGEVKHGTPVQFSGAAFLQRTLSSYRLYNAFRLISNDLISFVVVPAHWHFPIRVGLRHT